MVYECTLDLGTTHPVREARNEEEFIENLILNLTIGGVSYGVIEYVLHLPIKE